MAAKRTTRVVLNRRTIEGIHLAIADGAFEVAKEQIALTRVPDAPPYGRGLLEGGGALAWAGKKKIGGTTIGGRQITKPRAVKLADDVIQAIAGYGFHARFVQFGTVDTKANPFFFLSTVEGRAASIMAKTAKYRVARLR